MDRRPPRASDARQPLARPDPSPARGGRGRGFILGLDDEFFTDQGAYVRTHGGTVSDLAAGLLPGPYVIPAYRAVGHIRLTNKTPAGTYRAPGRYETTFARERLIDAIAAARSRPDRGPARQSDPRGRDALRPRHRHARHGHRLRFRQVSRPARTLLTHVGYENLGARLAARRAQGEAVGLGLAFFVEKSGLGPNDVARSAHGRRHDRDRHRRRLARAGGRDGDGADRADAWHRRSKIPVIHGQTDRIAGGIGAFASRVTVMTGSAVISPPVTCSPRRAWRPPRCCRRPARWRSARRVLGAGGGSVSLAGVAARREAQGRRMRARANIEHMTYPYGVHFAQVRVDRRTAARRHRALSGRL